MTILETIPSVKREKGQEEPSLAEPAGRTWAEPASRPPEAPSSDKARGPRQRPEATHGALLPLLLPVEQERLASSGDHGAAKLSSGWPVRAHEGTMTGVAGQLITPASGPGGARPSTAATRVAQGPRTAPGQQQTQPLALAPQRAAANRRGNVTRIFTFFHQQ